MLASANPQARDPMPAAFKPTLKLLKDYIDEKGILNPEHVQFMYVMTAMSLSNQRQAAFRTVEDDVFPLSVFQRIKDRIDLPECKTNLSRAIVALVKKAGKQQGSTRLGRASKNIASKILDDVAPAIDEQAFERRGFVILLNECQRLQAMFGKIPNGYKSQLVSVLENYDMITQSPKRKADYIRGLLLLGRNDLNERHREVLDIFLKNDFDRDEVSFE